ncbi:hypothetical protein PIB30_051341 [Stylosanthes scabra]|uniref:ARM repeat superfamily protein n=1 Tax=Stylosanthes scabra TaxID=79078 RepID=A0ABU6WJI9_9FABA|nr:hypothetical protein [Stylosanthes scabra]
MEMEMEDDPLRSATFQRLKSLSLQLLQLLQNPHTLTHAQPQAQAPISHLLHFLQTSSPSNLQPFFDYTLFPLLLLLDAAIQCRSTRKVDSQEKFAMSDISNSTLKVSDSVAEGVVSCLQELLSKCCLMSVEQMVVLLKKLTYGALLTPDEASEEFREGIILCFRALLMSLSPCSDMSCSCKQISGVPALSDDVYNDAVHHKCFKSGSESEECLLAFLQSQSASAAVGHWLSLLLKAADTEATRGQLGSARLRIEAFKALRVLIAKVGFADALAFFLPGVVSQFAKVLHGAKITISGAAGSIEAMEHAIRGLAEFLMIVLEDDANALALDNEVTTNFVSNDLKSSSSLLEELRHLAIKDSIKIKAEEDRKKLRKGLVDAIKGLLLECCHTLGESRLMFLECLCSLVVDDSEDVSSTAQDFLESLMFSQHSKTLIECDATEIFIRHLEKLPKMVLGNEESLAVLHAQQLLTIIFYSGPHLLVDHLQSPVGAARFLDVFATCLSHNSVFSGSLGKLISTSRSSTMGYLPSITELKSGASLFNYGLAHNKLGLCEAPKFSLIDENIIQEPLKTPQKNYELPRMPPWFGYVGSPKLYKPLAGILRLVGLSLLADRSAGLLSHVTETLLGYFRKLISELRLKEYNKESWQLWYDRTGSGQLLRQASTAVCMLNEILFGLSDQAIDGFSRMFHRSTKRGVQPQSYKLDCTFSESLWKMPKDKGKIGSYLVDCIGGVLHEYLSAELWNVPLEHRVAGMHLNVPVEDTSLYFFQDVAMLHEVIIEGIGIFNLCLGRDFISSGFLHTSLYLLLENLSSPNFHVRNAADSVLHVVSNMCGYPMVGQLVLENADYVIDSICRQLRHLDLNHRVPNVLASILSYIGVAHKILPLLDEPMHSVSVELEILARHQHPDLTIPFLKAVSEVARASKREACQLSPQAESLVLHVKSVISNAEETTQDQWEIILFKLNDSRRYRQTVGSVASSCVTATTPLLASYKQDICLAALDIIEDAMLALAKVEATYKHEREIRAETEEMLQSLSLYQLMDSLDATKEGADENRLLPAMNKIWPFLVTCIRNRKPLAVRRCLNVISNLVQICGGDFFTKRFQTDGTHFWKLLTTSSFQKKSYFKEEKTPLLLLYRSSSMTSEDSLAETSYIKVQIALLNMIADLCQNKRSATALQLVLKKVSGLVVGIACSSVIGLRKASLNALHGLASVDPDLAWLLIADIYYTMNKSEMLSPPRPDLPDISEILPLPTSPKEYLYVQYAGQSSGFDIDLASLEVVFHSIDSQYQLYR